MPKAIHPGVLLAQQLREARTNANRVATAIDVPRNRLTMILRGERSVTTDTAIRLSHWLRTDPLELLIAQAKYDIAVTSRALKTKLARMPTREDAP